VQVEHFAHGEDEVEAARKWLEGSQGRAVLARTQAIIAPLRELGLPAFTVHESKGLEWSQVWVMGCETSLFPHALGIKEEERRLFYVAMTRAKDYLRMSYCGSRAQNTKKPAGRHPSPFLYEAQSLDG
jgi:superfamily I DNA/RNA helicase